MEPRCTVVAVLIPSQCKCGASLKSAHVIEQDGPPKIFCSSCCPVHRDVKTFVQALCEAVPVEAASK